MITSRERLRRCFFHEELDRPGVYVRTGYPKADPTYRPLIDLLEARTDLKRVFAAMSLVEAPPTAVSEEPFSEDFKRVIQTVRTPAGELRSTALVGLKHQPGMDEKPLLDSVEDAEKYLSLSMPRIAGDVDRFFQMDKQLGDRGIVDVSLGFNPGGFVADLFGSATFAMLSITDRDVLHALCQRRQKIMLAVLEHLLSRGVGPYFSMLGEEYVTPPLHGLSDFDDFNLRYDKPIIDRVHAAGGRVHVHCHGRIKTVLPSFVKMGVDVLHPFEAPPMGDITPREAKAVVRGRICLEGNIQIADMYEQTPENVRDQTRRLIAEAFDDRKGLIVCPTASPWSWGEGARCLRQFQAMIEEVERYGT